MTRVGKSLLCGAVTLSLCGAFAVTTENPYQAIIDRNIFGIKDPPPPPPPPGSEKPAPPGLILTGITTVNGRAQALLKTAAAAAKPGGQATPEQSFILSQDQREGDLHVLAIDPKASVVKVRYAGQDLTLDFEKNGPKLPSTPPPGPAPGVPGAQPRLPGAPGASPTLPTFGGAPLPANSASPLRSIPTRSTRTTANPSAAVPLGGTGNPLGFQGGVGTPNYARGVAQVQPSTPQPVLNPEEQEIVTEAHREYYKAQNDPRAALLPPTRFTPALPPLPGQTQPAQNPF